MAGLHMVCFHMMNLWITSKETKTTKCTNTVCKMCTVKGALWALWQKGQRDKERQITKKKQRKILAENSWLAKFVLTAKDVFDRNTNSQTLPEKKSLLSCILNFRNQLEDFTLTISCWRPCWCWWAAQVRSSLGPWGTLEGPWLVPPRSTTTLTQTSLLLAGRNTRRDQVRPKKNRWAWIELKFIQLT